MGDGRLTSVDAREGMHAWFMVMVTGKFQVKVMDTAMGMVMVTVTTTQATQPIDKA